MVAERVLRAALDELRSGRISRRSFLERTTAAGVALPVVQFLLRSAQGAAAPPGGGATPVLAPRPDGGRPVAGTQGQRRGAGGDLRLLQWQAPSHASAHTSTGTKDTLAASLVTEPLMNYLSDARLVPTLVREVPSKENRLLSADLRVVTYRLREGVAWSDGRPLTAADVAFTWRWIMDTDHAATTRAVYEPIARVEAIDELTVEVTFSQPTLVRYLPFAGSTGGIYPAHILGTDGGAIESFGQRPVGTGPFVVESFSPNDQVVYVANERYREPNKPFFARVILKGGGDAASAARAVLQTGDYDLAWNLQVEPEVLRSLAEGGKGRVVAVPGGNVEQIRFNFSDPNREVRGQRSYWQQPHPFLADRNVRRALTLGADRATIAERFYQEGERPAANVLVGIPAYESTNTSWEFDVARSRQLLDEAGWTTEGGVRAKNGIELRVAYATTINAVRQKTQAVIKRAWAEMDIETELRQVDAGVFFDGSPGNGQNEAHFYSDLQMSAPGPGDPYPIRHMARWYSNNGQNIAQRENGWSRMNVQRYANPDYDRWYEALLGETDPERAAELFVRLNDILIDDAVVIPLVQRAAVVYGIATSLRDENVAAGPFEVLYWNIANWNRVS